MLYQLNEEEVSWVKFLYDPQNQHHYDAVLHALAQGFGSII